MTDHSPAQRSSYLSKSIESIELVYFDIHARGELTRLLFAAAGKENDYQDTRLPLFMESKAASMEWNTVHSPKTPFGYVPYINVTETMVTGEGSLTYRISGDGVLETFVARQLGLLGGTEQTAGICSTVANNAVQLLGPQLTRAGLIGDEATIPQMVLGSLEKLENYVEEVDLSRKGMNEDPNSVYVLGTLTLADLAIYNTLDECIKGPRSQRNFKDVEKLIQDKCPRLSAIYKAVELDLGDYLERRQAKFVSIP